MDSFDAAYIYVVVVVLIILELIPLQSFIQNLSQYLSEGNFSTLQHHVIVTQIQFVIRYTHHILFGSCWTNASVRHLVFVHFSSQNRVLISWLSLNFIWLVSDTLSNSSRSFSRLISYQKLTGHFHPGVSSGALSALPLHLPNHSQWPAQEPRLDPTEILCHYENPLVLHGSSIHIHIHWQCLDPVL